MITLYLICKLTSFLVRLCLSLLFLPFRLLLLPFSWLFGGSGKHRWTDDDSFWTGFLLGSLWD